MAKRKRDYKAEYARRNARAKKAGFTGYGQQRRIIEKFNKSEYVDEFGTATSADPASVEAAKAFYDALLDKSNANDYSIGAPKGVWFVEYLEIMDEEEWSRRYPNGTRYG